MTDPLTNEELAALRAITTPTVCNAIETFDVRPRNQGFMDSTIKSRFPELGVMVGYAVTLKIRASEPPGLEARTPREWSETPEAEVPPPRVWEEMEKVPKPWVVVIDDLDYPRPIGSFWGEVNGAVYKALGAVGTVTNGGVRDLPEVRATGFHFFSSCILVSHAYVHVVEVGGPATVGGLTVRPGDLLHGDEHGVTSIPMEIARDLPKEAAQLEMHERRLIGWAQSPNFTREGLEERYRRVD